MTRKGMSETNQDARAERVRAKLTSLAGEMKDRIRRISGDDAMHQSVSLSLVDQWARELERLAAVLALLDEARPTLDVEALRANLHATFSGGWHHSDDGMRAFHHGMDTVCNVLADKQKGGNANHVWPAPPSSPGRQEGA